VHRRPDNDESSFATGIPGDNIDTVNQDCFFDGNSGGGDDGCDIHVCCLLGAPDRRVARSAPTSTTLPSAAIRRPRPASPCARR
jgi:hypothetical protein